MRGVSALAVAAAIFALLALITGLVALYVRLEPDYGAFQASQYRWRGSCCDRVGLD
jgi:hypothetical protein